LAQAGRLVLAYTHVPMRLFADPRTDPPLSGGATIATSLSTLSAPVVELDEQLIELHAKVHAVSELVIYGRLHGEVHGVICSTCTFL
jgi:hypothetical protein